MSDSILVSTGPARTFCAGFFFIRAQKNAVRKRGGKPYDAKNTHPNRSLCFSGSCYGVLDPLVENDSKKVYLFLAAASGQKKQRKEKRRETLRCKTGTQQDAHFKLIQSFLIFCS
ncbi:hypothetical protein P4B35_07520 [Pontiellaceae bacterium B12227]|nr:hypothetical protein [Pontiellaceae bacterium B12227]